MLKLRKWYLIHVLPTLISASIYKFENLRSSFLIIKDLHLCFRNRSKIKDCYSNFFLIYLTFLPLLLLFLRLTCEFLEIYVAFLFFIWRHNSFCCSGYFEAFKNIFTLSWFINIHDLWIFQHILKLFKILLLCHDLCCLIFYVSWKESYLHNKVLIVKDEVGGFVSYD